MDERAISMKKIVVISISVQGLRLRCATHTPNQDEILVSSDITIDDAPLRLNISHIQSNKTRFSPLSSHPSTDYANSIIILPNKGQPV